MLIIIAVVAALACVVLLVFVAGQIAAAHAARRFPAPGLRVPVGQQRLHLLIQGSGPLTVLCDSGLAQSGLAWSWVAQEVATHARVICIDRLNYSWSDAGTPPRTSARVVAELHAALGVAGITGPYLLVGHSWGGMNMRHFADRFPAEVGGLVLVDGLNADLFQRDRALFGGYIRPLRRTFRLAAVAGRLGWMRLIVRVRPQIIPAFIARQPETIRPALLAQYLNGRNFAAAAVECASVAASAADVYSQQQPLVVPVAVVTHGVPSMFAGLPQSQGALAESLWQTSQTEMATRAQPGKLFVAAHSGHDVHVDAPEVVIEAIRWVAAQTPTQPFHGSN